MFQVATGTPFVAPGDERAQGFSGVAVVDLPELGSSSRLPDPT